VTRVVKGYRRTEWQKTRDGNDGLDGRLYSRSAAAVYGMDCFHDAVWKTLEDRVEEMSKRVGQPPAPPPPAGPRRRRSEAGSSRTIRRRVGVAARRAD
jgi:hypothetical protein